MNAFAPPAARVPPNSVEAMSSMDGHPSFASTMAGIVVISSSTMIRGFMSWKYATVRSRSEADGASSGISAAGAPSGADTPILVTVTSATSEPQMSSESRTWATCGAASSFVHTRAAPTMTCARNRTSAVVARVTTARRRGRVVHARIATYTARRPTTAARTRCANIALAIPPSCGTSLPFMSGQSVNASPAPRPRTYAPTSRSANNDTAVTAARRTNGLFAPGAAGRAGRSRVNSVVVRYTSTPTRSVAVARCAVTSAGFRPCFTTIAPTTASAMINANAATAGTRIRGTLR